jgi:hypothetical protein
MRHSIFALEICAPYQAGSPMHRDLRAIVQRQATANGFQQKWQVYRDAGQVLHAHVGTFVRGCWDFFDDDARALRDFEMWTNGMLTEEGSRRAPSGLPDPYRGEARFMTFTMAFLLLQGSPTERGLAQRCMIPQEHLWRRSVFAHLLESIPYLNFASIKGDVMYLIPRDEDWGLTEADLQAEKFQYLRPVI